ncbi:MAG: GAF domain-containing sensor histidine kinase [Micromonosporaceae bacterium]|nr:GAF domain-containing sensor histidine kinase [Micromonosporaceae bacterium]
MLGLIGVLIPITTRDPRSMVWACLLAVAALPAVLPAGPGVPRALAWLATLGRVAEVLVTTLGASSLAATYSGPTASAMLPYLAVPVAVPALSGRLRESLSLLGLATGVLTVTGVVDGLFQDVAYSLAGVEWLVIAGFSAWFIGTMQRRYPRGPVTPTPAPYAEATRLLTQLRTVARRLPGATLDPGGIAEHLIEEARGVVEISRAAVLAGSGGSHLVVLAQSAADRVDWETSLDADSAIADAWASQQPQVSSRSQSRTAGSGQEVTSLVVPLVAGVRTVAVLALEADRAGAFPPAVVAKVAALAEPAALRLEAALLFDDVRSLATTEERQRLAREIHDGIAQELVIIGYGIDNVLGMLPDESAGATELRRLREEITRVITEVRMSLFELRSDVDQQGGLSAAVADYARKVGAASGLRVHLSIEATPARLPAWIEAELMRIAQEAINNARRHSGAQNLWVSIEIDPPYARIEISDDGAGIGPHRPEGRFGLAIMAERAQRIRGELQISPRENGGTSVAIVYGTPPHRSTGPASTSSVAATSARTGDGVRE